MGNSFNIIRVATPNFYSDENNILMNDVDRSKELLGDQLNFGWTLPSAFRALANPLAPAALPRKPDARKDFEGAIAYWHSLQWLLIYRLGWAHPGAGIAGIYDELHSDFPMRNDTLQLVKEVWFADGYLENYLWWTLGVNHSYLSHKPFHSDFYYSEPELQSEAFVSHSPAGMHLEPVGYHYFLGGEHERLPEVAISDNGARNRLTATFDTAWGWYDALCGLDEEFRDREVDVYVKSFGFMGTYMHSQKTGLWFTGTEGVHLKGNIL